MASRPLDKLLDLLLGRRKAPVLVVVQTDRGQAAVPADVLREHLRVR